VRDEGSPSTSLVRSVVEGRWQGLITHAPRLRSGRAGLVVAALATPFAVPADAQTRSSSTVYMAESERGRQFQEEYGFSDAIVVGDTIYLSGLVAGTRPGETDLKPAYDRVYKHIGAILKRGGAGYDDIVDMTSFHTDVEAQLKPMSEVHKTYVKAPYPAWTAIGVAKILGNGITEIKITARRPQGAAARK
jgi:enamine deaminase RidA (YjgF/YER057c/UK114 family)